MPRAIPSSSASALLQVRGLTVRYAGRAPDSVFALHQVALDIAPGEIVGILGESGCGKSTLALSILGLLPATAAVTGSILFGDQDLLRLGRAGWEAIRGAKIAMMFQEPSLSLSPVMRVGSQIVEVIRAHHRGEKDERQAKVESLLRDVGFADVQRIYKAYPHQLSGGQLHRVAIAQALACQPDLMIADEPTRPLDASLQAEVLDVLRETNRKFGSALIFITHNPVLLAGFADRVVVMYGGRIVEEGAVSTVFRNPLHPYTQGLLQLVPRSPQHFSSGPHLPVIPGSLSDSDRLSPGCIFEPRCQARTAVCRNESPTEVIPENDRRVSCFNYGH